MDDARDAADARLLADGEHARLLARWEPVIVQRCVAGLRGHSDAEDVAQDVKLRLWRELQAGKRYEGIPYRVIVHQVITWTVKDYFSGRRTDLPLPDGWEPAAAGNPYDLVTVRSVLSELPGKTRLVCELRYLEGFEIEEIASRLGMTRNAVDQALHRAHRKLRPVLTDG